MPQPWYMYPIPAGGSHAAGDDGDDVDTPDRTPITLPFGGTVEDASYHDYGGQVVVDVPGTGYSEYAIHLNNIYVTPGQQLPAGAVIGDSGGGIGDLLLHNGRVQPARSQSWFDGHSTGYHTEYGLFEGDTLAQFNEGWGNHSRQLDPTGIIEALRAGQVPQWPGSNAPNVSNTIGLSDPITTIGPNSATAAGKILGSLGFTSWGNALQRGTVGAVGVVAILVAVALVLVPEGMKAQDALSAKAEQALGMILGTGETGAAVKAAKAARSARSARSAKGGRAA